MTLVMGGVMGLVMLAWMLSMYRNTKLNVAIIALVSPEVSAMRLVLPGAAGDREIATARPMALNGALWRVATLPLENAQQKYQVEIVALDAGGNVLDETFARQPRTP